MCKALSAAKSPSPPTPSPCAGRGIPMSRCYRPGCCAFAGLCGTGCRCCTLLAALLAAFFSLGSRLRKERGIALKTCERVGAVVQDNKKRVDDASVVDTRPFETAPFHEVSHGSNTYQVFRIMRDVIISIAVGRCSDIKTPYGSNAGVVYYIDATDSPYDRDSPTSGRKITLTTSSKGRSSTFRGTGAWALTLSTAAKITELLFQVLPPKK